jgi:hypothetical protein
MFNNSQRSAGASSEDREGFRRIMAMLGEGGNKPHPQNVRSLILYSLNIDYG